MKLLLFLLIFSTSAFATSSRYLDAQYILNGFSTLTLPASSDTLIGRDTADSLTNKTINAASNTISNIAAASVVGLSGTNSGDVTISSSGTQNGLSLAGQVLSIGQSSASASGVLSASNFVLFSGKLTSPLSTKGDILVHDGSNPVRLIAGTNGYFLKANSGATNGVEWDAIPVSSPSIVGTEGSATTIVASSGVIFSGSNYNNIQIIEGFSGAVIVSANPQITAATSVGQKLMLIGNSDTNTVELNDGTGLALNGKMILKLKSIISLVWTGSVWTEESRR